MDPTLSSYLSTKESLLSSFHPQWNYSNEEIFSSLDLLKRDGTPICIPPSWDLISHYAGPEDERADGFDKDQGC
jgi:hypothetical protein